MPRHLRSALVATFCLNLAQIGSAYSEDIDAAPAPDPDRPAVGEWIGAVSWNDPLVTYVWVIESDATFASGRAGRGLNGAGAWSAEGAHLVLKYEDGFRYEGELHDDTYSGTAYRATGQALGGFSMTRSLKTQSAPEFSP